MNWIKKNGLRLAVGLWVFAAVTLISVVIYVEIFA